MRATSVAHLPEQPPRSRQPPSLAPPAEATPRLSCPLLAAPLRATPSLVLVVALYSVSSASSCCDHRLQIIVLVVVVAAAVVVVVAVWREQNASEGPRVLVESEQDDRSSGASRPAKCNIVPRSRAISARLAGFRPFPGAHRPPPDAPPRAAPVYRAGGPVRASVPSPRPALSQTIPRPSAPVFLSCRPISAKTPPEPQLSPKSYPASGTQTSYSIGRFGTGLGSSSDPIGGLRVAGAPVGELAQAFA